MLALPQEKIKKSSNPTVVATSISFFVFLAIILVPHFVHAQSLEFPDCIQEGVNCGFNDFVEMVSNLIQFLLLLSIPIATLMFAWAGWLMVTAAGNSGQVEKAKEIFWDVLIGFVIALTAWLVVKLITSALLAPGFLGDADLLGYIQKVRFMLS